MADGQGLLTEEGTQDVMADGLIGEFRNQTLHEIRAPPAHPFAFFVAAGHD